MPQLVTMGAMMICTMGVAPSTLIVTPENLTNVGNKPAATIMDNIPMKNIMPFGMCNSKTNPAGIAATAAAMGTPTPVPCTPATAAPWAPPATKLMIKNKPALLNNAKLVCTLGGSISITVAGQFTVQS